MGSEALRNTLRGASEVELTVTGRASGRKSTRPVWFVEEGHRLYLLPVGGSDSNWFKNARKTPRVGLAADGAEFQANAKPLQDAAAVGEVVEKFRKEVQRRSGHEPITPSRMPLSRSHSRKGSAHDPGAR